MQRIFVSCVILEHTILSSLPVIQSLWEVLICSLCGPWEETGALIKLCTSKQCTSGACVHQLSVKAAWSCHLCSTKSGQSLCKLPSHHRKFWQFKNQDGNTSSSEHAVSKTVVISNHFYKEGSRSPPETLLFYVFFFFLRWLSFLHSDCTGWNTSVINKSVLVCIFSKYRQCRSVYFQDC